MKLQKSLQILALALITTGIAATSFAQSLTEGKVGCIYRDKNAPYMPYRYDNLSEAVCKTLPEGTVTTDSADKAAQLVEHKNAVLMETARNEPRLAPDIKSVETTKVTTTTTDEATTIAEKKAADERIAAEEKERAAKAAAEKAEAAANDTTFQQQALAQCDTVLATCKANANNRRVKLNQCAKQHTVCVNQANKPAATPAVTAAPAAGPGANLTGAGQRQTCNDDFATCKANKEGQCAQKKAACMNNQSNRVKN